MLKIKQVKSFEESGIKFLLKKIVIDTFFQYINHPLHFLKISTTSFFMFLSAVTTETFWFGVRGASAEYSGGQW